MSPPDGDVRCSKHHSHRLAERAECPFGRDRIASRLDELEVIRRNQDQAERMPMLAGEPILDGKLAMSVETNPRFGPLLFDTIAKYLKCEQIPPYVEVQDRVFDSTNVDAKAVEEAF